MTDIMTYAAQVRETAAKVIEVIASKVEASPSKQYIWAIIDDVRWIVERIYMSKPIAIDNIKVWNWESGEKKLTDFSMLQLAKLADEMIDNKGVVYRAMLLQKREGIGENSSFNALDCVGVRDYFDEKSAWLNGVDFEKYRWEKDTRYTYWLEVRKVEMSTWEMNVERWRQIREDLREAYADDKTMDEPALARKANQVYRGLWR